MATGGHPTTPDKRSSELTARYSETAQGPFSPDNPADTLRVVADCDRNHRLTSPASSSPTATPLPARSEPTRWRPGSKWSSPRPGRAPASTPSPRAEGSTPRIWPTIPARVSFGPEAAKVELRSALALRLSDDASRGAALILYGPLPPSLRGFGRAKGVILAAMASWPSPRPRPTQERRAETIQAALATPGDDCLSQGDPDGARTHQRRRGLRPSCAERPITSTPESAT